MGKVLEKIVYEQLYSYFTSNKLFHPNLHGYRQNRSTQTALLQMYDTWVEALANGEVSAVIMLYMSAAFDMVDHRILLSKMILYGFQERSTTWLGSYL